MHLALRPYVTTGVAIVGATVIAVAPMQPVLPDIQISNPTVQLDRAVQLTANEVEDAVNALIFAALEAGVSIAELPVSVIGEILGLSAAQIQGVLAIGTLGAILLGGSLISGPGAAGSATQDVIDALGSGSLATIINALVGAPGTVLDGVVNGGYGPNLTPLVSDLLDLPIQIPPSLVTILAGGLINQPAFDLVTTGPPFNFPIGLNVLLPGTVPTLQLLVSALFGPPEATTSGGFVEDAVNTLVFAAAQAGVFLAELPAPLIAQITGLSPEEAQAVLALGTLGLLGPLISGPGAAGTATQDVINALGSGNLANIISALIGAPATVLDGVVNGGYGPNLGPLLGAPSLITILAGGLINPEGGTPPLTTILPGTIPTVQGLVDLLFGLLTPSDIVSVNSAPGNVALAAPPGIPGTDLEDVLGAVQAAAERVLTDVDNLPGDVQELVRNVARNPQSLPLEVAKLVDRAIDTVKVAGDTVGLAVVGTLPEDLRAPAAALPLALGGAADDISDRVVGALTPKPSVLTGGDELRSTQADAGQLPAKDQVDPGVPPKKPRGPLVNILKHNPLNPGKAAINGQGAGDEVDGDQATENGTTVKRFPSHRLGEGQTPVRDLVKRVLGGGKEDNAGPPKDEGGPTNDSETG